MLQPPLPLHSFLPAQAFDSGTAQPPLPLHSLSPMQQALPSLVVSGATLAAVSEWSAAPD